MGGGKPKYEDWLKISKDKTIQSADTTYAEATRQSDVARQRAIVDADTSYQKNVSDYGANAERLASMGLTNSGYADYQKSQSYAQMRGEVQYANAQKVASDKQAAYNRDQTKLGAEITYAQGMANKALSDEQTKNTTYLELLSGAGNGTYSEEQIRALGTQVGLSEEEIENVVGVYNEYSTKLIENQWADIKTGVDDGTYDADYVREWAIKNGYVDENGNLNAEAQAIYDKAVSNKTESDLLYWAGIEESARKGETSAEVIYDMAKAYGYINEDGTWNNDAAKEAYDAAVERKQKDTAYGWADAAHKARNGELTSDDILAMAKTEGVYKDGEWLNTPEALAAKDAYDTAKKKEKTDKAEKIYNEAISDLAVNGVFADIHSILNDKNNGLIAQEEYDKLERDWNAIAETELEAILTDLNAGAVYDQRELKQLLEHISNAPMSSNVSSLYLEVNEYYQKKYGSASGTSATSKTMGGEPSYMSYIPKTNDSVKAINIDSNELANEGDWFTIKVGESKKWVKSGGLVEGNNITEAAKGLSDNTVFLYNNEIYIKYGNEVYSVKARSWFGGAYDDVYKALSEGTSADGKRTGETSYLYGKGLSITLNNGTSGSSDASSNEPRISRETSRGQR